MKKIYSLALAVLFGASAFAQVDETFVFTDANGNVVPDGTTITVNNFEIDDFTGEPLFPSGLSVKNNSAANAFASMKFTISQMDNGKLQHCFPGQCQVYSAAQSVTRSDAKGIKAGENQSIQSEWLPDGKGQCSVAYTIRVMKQVKPMPPTYNEQATGATVTVNYIYDDNSKDIAAGIKDVNAASADKNGAVYNMAGQKVGTDYKGVVIRNGKKYVLK